MRAVKGGVWTIAPMPPTLNDDLSTLWCQNGQGSKVFLILFVWVGSPFLLGVSTEQGKALDGGYIGISFPYS